MSRIKKSIPEYYIQWIVRDHCGFEYDSPEIKTKHDVIHE